MVLACALVGCSDAADELALAPAVSPQCSITADCGPNARCDDVTRICVATDVASLQVAVVATPPLNADLVAPKTPAVHDLADETLSLELPPVVTVTGRIQVEDTLLDSGVASVITAVAQQDYVPDGLIVQQSTATEKDGFTLHLQRGVEYEISVAIKDADPARPIWRMTKAFDKDVSETFVLPNLEAYPVVTGRLFQQAAETLFPLADVSVTAINVSSKAQCTSAVTDHLGRYRILCPIGSATNTYDMLVAPTDDGPVVPSFTAVVNHGCEVAEDCTGPALIDGDTEMPDIVLKEGHTTATVTIQVTGPDNDVVAGVPVTLSVELPEEPGVWTKAVLRRTEITDNGGKVTFDVLQCAAGAECTYTVSADPHPTLPMSGLSQQWDVRESTYKELSLPRKVTIRGEVLTASGNMVEGALVTARRVAVDMVTNASTELEYWVETDAGGLFELPVDIGDYLVTVVPPAGSGIPRYQKTMSVGEQGLSAMVEFALPTILQGTVSAPGGLETVANATVDVYTRPTDGSDAVLLGTAQSGADGRYFVILPAE